MQEFEFEIVRQGDASVIAHVLRLPSERVIWRQVEELALRIGHRDCAFIRVKNSKGETLVRTGVATAIASIEKCSHMACPLKGELRRQRVSNWRQVGDPSATFENLCSAARG
jgi:hypothetical protein